MSGQILVNVLCILIAAGALATAAWALISGQLGEQGIDGLFLVAVCLVIALIFSMIPLEAVRRGGWRNLLKRKKSAVNQEERGEVAAVASQERT
jgi:hypothetical protein